MQWNEQPLDPIVCISGSSRPGNYTTRALKVVTEHLQTLGATTTSIEARELSLTFPGQAESADARKLREAVTQASAIVLASPEYHGSFSAMTKLVIENLGFPSAMEGKAVALLGVASGRIGAIKTLEQMRSVCAHIGAIVMPGAVSIAGVRSVFDENGNIIDKGSEKALHGLADSMMRFMKDYICPKHTLESIVREQGLPWSATL